MTCARRFRRHAAAALLAACLAVLMAPAGAASEGGDYVIGPQDVLLVTVFDQADLGGKYAVELDGTFSFPLIGRVTAGGGTLRDVEIELDQHIVRIIYEDLPTRAVRHHIDTKRHAFLREVPLHWLKATTAKGDVIDDA